MSEIPQEATRGRATTARPLAQRFPRCFPTASRGRAPGAEPNRHFQQRMTRPGGTGPALGPSPAVFAAGPGPGSAGAEPRMKLENDLHWKSPSPRGADPPSLAVQCAWALSGTFRNHSSALHWP
ncbi:uncharacterized protein LOC144335156 [Macaca mulatta]